MYHTDNGTAVIVLDQLPSDLIPDPEGEEVELIRKTFAIDEALVDFTLFVGWELLAVRT